MNLVQIDLFQYPFASISDSMFFFQFFSTKLAQFDIRYLLDLGGAFRILCKLNEELKAITKIGSSERPQSKPGFGK